MRATTSPSRTGSESFANASFTAIRTDPRRPASAGRVVSRSEILSQVWEVAQEPGSNVIEVHIKNLRDKLGERGPGIETVRGVGYVVREGEE